MQQQRSAGVLPLSVSATTVAEPAATAAATPAFEKIEEGVQTQPAAGKTVFVSNPKDMPH